MIVPIDLLEIQEDLMSIFYVQKAHLRSGFFAELYALHSHDQVPYSVEPIWAAVWSILPRTTATVGEGLGDLF